MEKIERKMQEFEESLEMEKQETEKRDKEVEDFEGEMERGRNEGMFFQSFRQRKAMDKAKAKEEAKRISHVTRKSAASKARRNIYLALIGLLTIGIVNSLLSYPQNCSSCSRFYCIAIPVLL
uniref:Uncharacterized protein n=1 Tax=Opuntia streptacantha TaxID=393608 RepID=A0A7C9DCU2_OPUST